MGRTCGWNLRAHFREFSYGILVLCLGWYLGIGDRLSGMAATYDVAHDKENS